MTASSLDVPRRPAQAKVAGFTMTRHARERMVEMELTVIDVENLLTDFDRRYEQLQSEGPGRFCYQRDGLALATDERGGRNVIITVLYHRDYRWSRT